jgi:hypothetical protein
MGDNIHPMEIPLAAFRELPCATIPSEEITVKTIVIVFEK